MDVPNLLMESAVCIAISIKPITVCFRFLLFLLSSSSSSFFFTSNTFNVVTACVWHAFLTISSSNKILPIALLSDKISTRNPSFVDAIVTSCHSMMLVVPSLFISFVEYTSSSSPEYTCSFIIFPFCFLFNFLSPINFNETFPFPPFIRICFVKLDFDANVKLVIRRDATFGRLLLFADVSVLSVLFVDKSSRADDGNNWRPPRLLYLSPIFPSVKYNRGLSLLPLLPGNRTLSDRSGGDVLIRRSPGPDLLILLLYVSDILLLPPRLPLLCCLNVESIINSSSSIISRRLRRLLRFCLLLLPDA